MTDITKPIILDETGKEFIDVLYSIKRAIKGVKYNYKEWTLTINTSTYEITMSGDVKSWLIYRSKLGRYIVSNDGKARKLNKENSNLLEDGTSYDITSGHIMTRFPNLYFTCVTNSNIVTITLSEKPFANCKEFGEQWIGSYLGQVLTDGKLVSRSGLNPTRNMTINSFWTAAQKNGSNWGLSDYRQRQMMMVIYLCEFLDANSQKCLGYGMNGNVDNWVPVVYNAITGKTNILGDKCGKVNFLESGQKTNAAACHVSLFGIEDPYGWFLEFIQGVYFGSSNNSGQTGSDVYIYEGNRMPTSDELITQPTGLFRKITRVTSSGWIINLIWGENIDILPASIGGSSATGHGDYSSTSNTGQVLIFDGRAAFGAYCGFAFSASNDAWTKENPYIGARLAYYGVVDIV